jgi:hypothetical protein
VIAPAPAVAVLPGLPAAGSLLGIPGTLSALHAATIIEHVKPRKIEPSFIVRS